MELLTKAVPITMLAFVVSSKLAVGLSITIRQIVAPLRNSKLMILALLANFVLMPLFPNRAFTASPVTNIQNAISLFGTRGVPFVGLLILMPLARVL
jgi:predicted Na+-dependent transporter